MKISFSSQYNKNDDLLIIYSNKSRLYKTSKFEKDTRIFIDKVDEVNKSKKNFLESLKLNDSSNIKNLIIAKSDLSSNPSNIESLSGKILSELEKKKIKKISIFVDYGKNNLERTNLLKSLSFGFLMKDYRFEKYKTITKKDFQVENLKFVVSLGKSEVKELESHMDTVNGIYLTRDLVSEPANILSPQKFVEFCHVLNFTIFNLPIVQKAQE